MKNGTEVASANNATEDASPEERCVMSTNQLWKSKHNGAITTWTNFG